VINDKSISDLLAAPLGQYWTVDQLAEEVLCAIATRGSDEVQEVVLDAEATQDRQSRRLLRPLLACLAAKSAAEAGTPPNLYGGRLSFQRPGHEGPVWILGQFENTPGTARISFRRSSLPPKVSELTRGEYPVRSGSGPQFAEPSTGVESSARDVISAREERA
jgi:hypothetical protein